MSKLSQLKDATSLSDLASLIGFKPAGLSYVLYKKPPGANYYQFEIPKRLGGSRTISAPHPDLRLIQRRLATLLYDCVDEINAITNKKNLFSHGFMRQRSIVTNAACHRKRRFVFNIDLVDFFGSINFGRVRGYFLKNRHFALNSHVATVIAQVACHQNSLPQGSPCSPIISNLIGHLLDIRLVKLAGTSGCTFTRYADDLTFSTNANVFPPSIAITDPNSPHVWLPSDVLTGVVERSGFLINAVKTRMQYRRSRQDVTGLVVNRRVNIRSEYRRVVRAMVHRLVTTGSFELPLGSELAGDKKTSGAVSQLNGMLNFIYSVDDFDQRRKRAEERKNVELSCAKTYRLFLLFRDFYAAQLPVLIGEGPTDNIYLTHAIHKLAEAYPLLASKDAEGKAKLKVRIYKYSGRRNGHVLGMGGGTADLTKFIYLYHNEFRRFSASGATYPVIVIVDNDSGAKSIYELVKNITKVKPSGAESFIHVTGNLYVVATPLPQGALSSVIEDAFDLGTKEIKIDGKHFDPYSSVDRGDHYGKMVFAHKVIAKNHENISFDGFKPLLERISLAIECHAEKVSSSATASEPS